MNVLRNKLENKEKIRGTLVSLTDPCLCEIMGKIGYDCVWIDMEHTYMSEKEVLCHLNGARSGGISSIVRLPQDDLTVTKKILEMGPDGVIFPMAKSAEDVRRFIDMTLYPPHGFRGFGPIRAIGYGADDVIEYVEKKSLEMLRFVQIESIGAIEELEEIVKIPFVDGFIFGPNDLSGSVGDFMNVFGEKTISQIEKAIEILRKHRKFIGLAGGMAEGDIQKWSSFDLDMLFTGADWCFVYNKGKDNLETMKKYF